MDSNARRPAVEIAAEWSAASCLGAAVAFALLKLGLFDFAAAGGVGLAGAATALLALGKVDGGARFDMASFAPAALPGESGGDDAESSAEVLLLVDAVEAEPLPAEEPEAVHADTSRVVRLFGSPPPGAAPAALLPPPGEMVARIEDFLGTARGGAVAAEPAATVNAASDEASAALHAALADIRRSLRRG